MVTGGGCVIVIGAVLITSFGLLFVAFLII
jgi:hypothetical protein